jgi:cyclopropane fatty-acyl-phospholipid synthase-like methyltransferase
MTDLFADKAATYDTLPMPQRIAAGVQAALAARLSFDPRHTLLDVGAGTGMLTEFAASRVGRLIAVDVSAAMLAQLAARPSLQGRVEIVCQDIVTSPLGMQVDRIVSAMAMHHIADTAALLQSLAAHTRPGGQIALADLDTEDGTFHPPNTPGVFHAGFDRVHLQAQIEAAGFVNVAIDTACSVDRDGRPYTIFLATATRAAG